MKQQCIKFVKWVLDNGYVFLKGGESEGWYKDSLDIEPKPSYELYDLYMKQTDGNEIRSCDNDVQPAENRTGIAQYNQYKDNGGTMSFTEWYADGRYDKSAEPITTGNKGLDNILCLNSHPIYETLTPQQCQNELTHYKQLYANLLKRDTEKRKFIEWLNSKWEFVHVYQHYLSQKYP